MTPRRRSRAASYERYMRTIRKMQPGTLGGQSKVATPVSQVIQVTTVNRIPQPGS